MQYCSLQYHTLFLSPVTCANGCCFCSGSISSFFSGIISPLISSSILGTYWPGEFIFHCPIFLLFITVHGVLRARILNCFAIPFSSGPHFVRTLHRDPSIYKAWLIVSLLEKVVIHENRLVSFLSSQETLKHSSVSVSMVIDNIWLFLQ